ncbi:magnesium/cobalt transporter CorA [Mucilaginibacter myungsuensis]|uniref:Magnesium transport protein CorA n=1 Tax=Mucilaginibacter myungsuensis TaxID=649104 RepID=A0A929KZ30_9SPHI|nr:magnesium/cobalt transporter CorA [Mucilaginibacter myungsuensis]MBE9660316.1 magnesium/cobalt transporter CorA [Mucilaginibacter myungsuensis]MDN3600358.1 magnesium/cobalt transporter CorA [Mucilaginibacter myungsuensis]
MNALAKAQLKLNIKKRMGNVGDSPGTIRIAEDAIEPKINIYSYNAQEVVKCEGTTIPEILEQFKSCPDHTHWIQINGLGDTQLIESIGEQLNINPLVLEDITSNHQRPKFEEYDDYVFAVSRIMKLTPKHELSNTQFSAIVKDKLIISFEEDNEDRFAPIKTRLKVGKGSIRTGGAGYMCYALMDMIIDQYFVILSTIGDKLDLVEEKLYIKPDKSIMYDAQHLKRALIVMRRASWPERDKINDMIRSDSPLITPETKTYLRDAYDHTIQSMDMIDSYKEITSSLVDLYLSMVSNRMNEIMKVLTIISVIFIPLTFIAGIYGMNFSREGVHGETIPDNMPELYWDHGYIYALILMGLIAGIQLFVFWRKGWFHRL